MNRIFYENLLMFCAQNLQGYYGRVYESYRHLDEDDKDRFCQELEDNNVKDMMDFIMYVEG